MQRRFRSISIHSLRMEGDRLHYRRVSVTRYFNPLPPHGGRQTHPTQSQIRVYFNPLPPHGGRRWSTWDGMASFTISIHSLRMEGDGICLRIPQLRNHFNPLPPHGGRLYLHTSLRLRSIFQSTPSAWRETLIFPLSGADLRGFQSTPSAWRETVQNWINGIGGADFNPLPPHGGRLLIFTIYGAPARFQSTPSAWRETIPALSRVRSMEFQSTPSAWRETVHWLVCSSFGGYFNPLPPHGGRRCGLSLFGRRKIISIHSLRMEGDSKTAQESVFHFAYPCTILQKRMQKNTFCTRKNGFFRKKGEKFGAKPSASFCAPMIRTDTFPLNFSHRISGSSMSMVSFAPICSTFD